MEVLAYELPRNSGHSVPVPVPVRVSVWLVQVVFLGRLAANKIIQDIPTPSSLGQSILYLLPLPGISNTIPAISTFALNRSRVHSDGEVSVCQPERRLGRWIKS